MPAYLGRLAPSPTGLLHLGHAATFLHAADRAHAAAGTLLLRNDDLDRDRIRPHFVTAMLEDLHWLGLRWHEPVLTQSTRLPLYRDALHQLLALGLAYPCTCSRRDLAQTLTAPHEDHTDEPLYPGHCRPPVLTPQPFHPDRNYRFRVPDGDTVSFLDGLCGPQHLLCGTAPPALLGDFLIWRRDGLPSYQLSSIVDDAALGITEVVRGRDLLRSTARQILLARALQLPLPAWFHTPLLVDATGTRLAKRHDSLALRTLRQQGLSPAGVQHLARTSPTR